MRGRLVLAARLKDRNDHQFRVGEEPPSGVSASRFSGVGQSSEMLVASQAAQMLNADARQVGDFIFGENFLARLDSDHQSTSKLLGYYVHRLTADNFACNSRSVPIAWDFQLQRPQKPFIFRNLTKQECASCEKIRPRSVQKRKENSRHGIFVTNFCLTKFTGGSFRRHLRSEAASLLESSRDLQYSAFGEVRPEDLHADW